MTAPTPVPDRLGEEGREAVRGALDQYGVGNGTIRELDRAVADVLAALTPFVAGAVSRAREEERERIARMLDGAAAGMADAETQVGWGRHSAYKAAAAIIREDPS